MTQVVVTLTTAGANTFISPVPVLDKVECWGASGGSGGATATAASTGGGSGAGEYAAETNVLVDTGVNLAPVVGGGGTAGAGTVGAVAGAATANTVFTGKLVTVTAHPGLPGTCSNSNGAAGTRGTGSTNSIHFDGGDGAPGVSSGHGGGGGGSAGETGAGGSSSSATGGTAGTGTIPGAAGANGASAANTAGNPGTAPGGGAGGAKGGAVRTGGAGANGKIVITYTPAAPAASYIEQSGYRPRWAPKLQRRGEIFQPFASGPNTAQATASFSASSSLTATAFTNPQLAFDTAQPGNHPRWAARPRRGQFFSPAIPQGNQGVQAPFNVEQPGSHPRWAARPFRGRVFQPVNVVDLGTASFSASSSLTVTGFVNPQFTGLTRQSGNRPRWMAKIRRGAVFQPVAVYDLGTASFSAASSMTTTAFVNPQLAHRTSPPGNRPRWAARPFRGRVFQPVAIYDIAAVAFSAASSLTATAFVSPQFAYPPRTHRPPQSAFGQLLRRGRTFAPTPPSSQPATASFTAASSMTASATVISIPVQVVRVRRPSTPSLPTRRGRIFQPAAIYDLGTASFSAASSLTATAFVNPQLAFPSRPRHPLPPPVPLKRSKIFFVSSVTSLLSSASLSASSSMTVTATTITTQLPLAPRIRRVPNYTGRLRRGAYFFSSFKGTQAGSGLLSAASSMTVNAGVAPPYIPMLPRLRHAGTIAGLRARKGRSLFVPVTIIPPTTAAFSATATLTATATAVTFAAVSLSASGTMTVLATGGRPISVFILPPAGAGAAGLLLTPVFETAHGAPVRNPLPPAGASGGGQPASLSLGVTISCAPGSGSAGVLPATISSALPRPPQPVLPTWQRDVQGWALQQEKQRHVQALWQFGELAVFALMWHLEDFQAGLVTRCQRCFSTSTGSDEDQISAAYGQGNQYLCPDCFNTTFEGGYRAIIVRPGIFGDVDKDQRRDKRGIVNTGELAVESTPDFRARTGDYCFRSTGDRYHLRVPRRTTLRTGFASPWQAAAAIDYNHSRATIEDPTAVAYIIPPTAAQLAEVLSTYTRVPTDFSWFETIRSPLIPGESVPPAARGARQPDTRIPPEPS